MCQYCTIDVNFGRNNRSWGKKTAVQNTVQSVRLTLHLSGKNGVLSKAFKFYLKSTKSVNWLWIEDPSVSFNPAKSKFIIKVSKTRKQIVKPWILPKNERMNLTLLLWYLRLTCFRSFFGRNWRHQKDISKLTDL